MIRLRFKYLIVFPALFLLSGCRFAKETDELSFPKNPNSDEKCYRNGKLSADRRKSIYPFNESVSVEIFSFNSRLGRAPISDTVNYKKVIEKIQLFPKDVDRLTDILYNYNYSKKKNVGVENHRACYYPRHAIVFLKTDGSVISYIELCLECQEYRSELPTQSTGVFCSGKYELLEKFFAEINITHFKDGRFDLILPEKK